MEYYSEDIILLRELLETKQVALYRLHEIYHLSPAQLARTINKFLSENIIKLEDDIAFLTPKGELWIICNRKDLFLKEKRKYWKEVPPKMKQIQIGINVPYKPIRKNLDKDIFKNIEDGKQD